MGLKIQFFSTNKAFSKAYRNTYSYDVDFNKQHTDLIWTKDNGQCLSTVLRFEK